MLFSFNLAPGLHGVILMEDSILSLNAEAVDTAEQVQSNPADFPEVTSDELLDFVLKSLNDDKAEEIITIDLRGKSAMGDYMVVCSGRSSRQVGSLAEKLSDKLKQELGRLSKMEGKGAGDWVLLDTGDIIIHVFRPEVREFYQLEKMWLGTDDAPEA